MHINANFYAFLLMCVYNISALVSLISRMISSLAVIIYVYLYVHNSINTFFRYSNRIQIFTIYISVFDQLNDKQLGSDNMHIYTCTYLYICIYLYMYIYVYIYMYIYIYIYTYVYLYICAIINVFLYVYISASSISRMISDSLGG
jgi:hypothetical protein